MVAVGKVRAIPTPDEGLLWDDDFTNGPSGWVPIISSARPFGIVSLDSSITHKRSRYSLRCETENYADGTANTNWSRSMILKRLWRGSWMRIVRAEWVFAYGAQHGGEGEEALAPRDIRFGIDTADFAGARRYFQIRYQLSGELNATEGAQRLERWQVTGPAVNGWTDIPGMGASAYRLGVNENKRNLFRVEMEVNVQTGRYLGLRVNGDGFGSLSADRDNTLLSDLPGPALEQLASFAGCLNPTFMISNRIYGPATDGNATKCWANLAYTRGRASA